MPLKLYLEVHLGHVETLNAPGIEILKAEKNIFTKNLLHCTATTTPKNENLSFTLFPSGNLIRGSESYQRRLYRVAGFILPAL